MKRKHYHLMSDGNLLSVSYAWNAAIKSMRSCIREVATRQNQDYEKISFVGTVNETGTWTWRGTKNPDQLLTYTIINKGELP